jgi:uncharacterized protein (TIGR02594 family)
MKHYDIAKSYIGTTEGPGVANNPAIIAMYATVGHDWVEHDDVAWCAAFVGHCLEKAGIRSTRKLTARSYLEWGTEVRLAEARRGDVAVVPRGNSSWQGHVFFIDRIEGDWVFGLGGNQSDAVNIKRFRASSILGVRRAPAPRAAGSLNVHQVQELLRDRGYHEVGAVDGKMGPRTRAAILAFRADNGLELVPEIDGELSERLLQAQPRKIAPERAAGVPEGSRIVTAANAQIGLGVVGAVGSVGSQIAPAVAEAEGAKDLAERMFSLLGLDGWLSAALPWIGAAVFIGVIIYAAKARNARIEDHRTGRTP